MNKINLLTLIKESGVARKFKNRDIPESVINNILEAGIWGLSILGIQPAHFVCVKNKVIIAKIAEITSKKSTDVVNGVNIIMKITSGIIKTSSVIITIFDNEKLQRRAVKFGKMYTDRAYAAELQAIGGAIQNMFLEANSLGISAAWLDAPVFCEKEINKLLGVDKRLIAFLALGYPAVQPKRSKRNERPYFIL